MRATSFLGPDRPDQDPLTDAVEVRAARRILISTASGADPDWLTIREIEGYPVSSAEELGALRDRELWGDTPFEED